MIEGIPVEDDKSTPLSDKFSNLTRSNIKLLGIAVSMAIIMLLVSLQGWIIDDVVDEIKKDLGIYDRVPVWERSEWPYTTDQANGFVMEYGDYELLEKLPPACGKRLCHAQMRNVNCDHCDNHCSTHWQQGDDMQADLS